MEFYKKPLKSVFDDLQSSQNGLMTAEVTNKQKKYGKNQLVVQKESIFKLLIEPFKSVFVFVLLIAVVVSIFSKKNIDAVVICSIIVINAVIYYTQQYATKRVLRSLKNHSVSKVTVLRNNKKIEVSSTEIVPGDIVFVSEGERVPADARLIEVNNLQVDESTLTGESVPVQKIVQDQREKQEIYEQSNMMFQGTYVTSGTAKILVVETGARTEFGKIAQLAKDDKTKSPVQAKIDNLISVLVKLVGLAAVGVFILAVIRGISSAESLRFALSLTVSAVPEGLPVALSVIIILGMRRMAKQKALVRTFKAIEDVGLITTIATDKTGTLTKNQLHVAEVWNTSKTDALTTVRKTLDSQAAVDPLDRALIDDIKNLNHSNKIYPFDLKLRMSGAFSESEAATYIKGSPESIVTASRLSKKLQKDIEKTLQLFTTKGYRVIAVAKMQTKKPLESLAEVSEIEFVGLIGLADQLRHEVPAAIKDAQSAGISIKMITGDHRQTAYTIGENIGVASSFEQVAEGTELPKKQTALAAFIKNKTVFSRIVPEDKFRILQALKQTEITAMTGDGVNDVPALTNAHVGFAMGSGSDIAKDAGGIVLLDNNFATIVQAIKEGRRIYDNIRRMLYYLLANSLGKVITMTGALLINLPLPVTAIQILWINLVTETTMAMPLGLEPADGDVMKRPPRRPKEPLLNKLLTSRMILIGFTMAAVILSIVATLRSQGQDVSYIRTVVFMTIVAGEWVNAFNARSEKESSFKRLKVFNPSLLVGLAVSMLLQCIVMFGPLKNTFGIVNVALPALLISSGVMIVSLVVVSELHKIILTNKTATKI